ncbi:MAG: class I SAM-dependent methyltransferase [Methyloligellaceae bacterium]
MIASAEEISIRQPNYARYKELSRLIKRYSLARCLQYEAIKMQILKGKVLDVGGGKNADYRPWLNCETYESINTDENMEPTWKVLENGEWPVTPESYDTVISFNTLEHIYDAKNTLKQMNKSLKKGGELLVTTPFLYPIHGCPDDFFRPTPSWYRHALSETDFDKINITPLVWGPFSTGSICSGLPGPFKTLRNQYTLLLDLLYSFWRNRSSGPNNSSLSLIPISLLVRATKNT